MVSYASLIRGAGGLAVVMPGDGKGSRIYEVIESGDMPRGGGKVDSAELATLTRWIDQGAKFDGRDPNAQLTSLVGEAPRPAPTNRKSSRSPWRPAATRFASRAILRR